MLRHHWKHTISQTFLKYPIILKCLPPKPPRIFSLTNPRVNKLKKKLHIDVFPIYLLMFDPKPSLLFLLHLKPQENAPCPHLDQNFPFSLKIMTLPRIFNFGMLTPRNPKMMKKLTKLTKLSKLTISLVMQLAKLFSHLA